MTCSAFVQTDPVPLVEGRVGGSEPLFLLIDTGASEVILDPAFAAAVGAARFGSATGTFGGGKQADYELATVGELALGRWRIRDLPVRLLPTRRFAGRSSGRTSSVSPAPFRRSSANRSVYPSRD